MQEGAAAGGRREGAREGPSPFGAGGVPAGGAHAGGVSANLKSEREGERAMRKHHGEIWGDIARYCEMLRDVARCREM